MGVLTVRLEYREVESAGEVEDITSRLLATCPDTMDSDYVHVVPSEDSGQTA